MNFDDPKLTAYALGELDSPDECEAIERLLKENPELATELEETRAVARYLRRELHAEETAPLAAHQREHVIAIANGAEPINGAAVAQSSGADAKVVQGPWWHARWVPSSIAATVILTTGIAMLWKQNQPSEFKQQAAMSPPPPAEPALAWQSQAGAITGSTAPASGPTLTLQPEAPNLLTANPIRDSEKGAVEKSEKEVKASTALALSVDNQIAAAGKSLSSTNSINSPAGPMPTPIAADVSKKLAEGDLLTSGTLAPTTSPAPALPAEQPAMTPGKPMPAVPTTLSREKNELAGRRIRILGQKVDADRGRIAANGGPLMKDKVSIDEALTASPASAPVALQSADPVAGDRRLPIDRFGGASVGGAFEAKPQQFRIQVEPSNTESYDNVTDNAFLAVKDNPLSTFSIDVDTASYANVRRFLTNNERPPKGAVRIEELINYFPYSYIPPAAESTEPFSVAMEVAAAPWAPQHRLVRVGIKGREIAKEKLPPSNLVFLLDVSGSMQPANKLPLVKQSMLQLVEQLREQDSVGIVVYAGASGVILEPTSDKTAIRAALERLESGGSTNGAAGIQAAYDLAKRAFKKEGNNRVILATDGDFNVGVTSQSDLIDLIQRRAKSGVFLSVLGFGMGNTKDSTMEKLADKGNGNYAYIDSLKEGRKVLVEEMSGTLFTIAKDVKIQVEFNPAKVGAYRLIGYENRLLAKEDFNDDTKDAGEIGAGHTVTALYEVVPAGQPIPVSTTVDPLKYQSPTDAAGLPGAPNPDAVASTYPGPTLAKPVSRSEELLTLKLRYKAPDGDKSTLKAVPLTDAGAGWEKSSPDFRWSAAVASFGMLLRDSPHRGNATWDSVTELANEGKGEDRGGYRTEFLSLVERARQLVPVTPLKPDTEEVKPVVDGKAAKLMIPEFDATDTAVLDVINSLSAKSKEVDPEKAGVSIVYSGPAAAAQTKLTFRMRNISVLEAARTLANIAGLKLEQQNETLLLKAVQ